MTNTRQQEKERLLAIANAIGDCNKGIDLGIEIANNEDGQLTLFLTGKIEGRSLKLPFSSWRFSKKKEGSIIGPSLPVRYQKHWRYKIAS